MRRKLSTAAFALVCAAGPAVAEPADGVATLDMTFRSVAPSFGAAGDYAVAVVASPVEAPSGGLVAVIPPRGYPLPRY
jgi:hypothetical protein